MKLRDYQQDCKDRLQANWDEGIKRQIAVMPTGAGKTVLFSALAQDFTSQGKGVLVVAHREELITQAASKLAQATGMQPGIIKSGYAPTDSLIQVASIQSLIRRKTYPPASLVIIDECHHAAAAGYRELINHYLEEKILGVTATPRRIDGYGFSDLFEEMVISVTPKQLMAEGHLCQYKLIGGFAKLGLYTPKGRDYTAKELERAATKIKPEDVVSCWHQFCKGKKTIVFALNVAHSRLIVKHFQESGIAAEHLDGDTPQSDRHRILERFRCGETMVLSNCGILTEGFDCPDIDAVQCARPTTSISLWLQMIGRALRPAPGKEYAVLVDQTDNWQRLGRPDDDRQWSLAPVSADEDSPGVRSCKECHHVFKPLEVFVKSKFIWDAVEGAFKTLLSAVCPNCGKDVFWQPSSGGKQEVEVQKENVDLDVEFREIPAECRFEILQRIGDIRKLGSRFKNLNNRQQRFHQELCNLVASQTDITLTEIKVGLEVLDIDVAVEAFLNIALGNRLRKYAGFGGWCLIQDLMSERPTEVKRIVWGALTDREKTCIRDLKTYADLQSTEASGENCKIDKLSNLAAYYVGAM